MPRSPRLEFAGAHYHVLNRGNYRSHVFASPGARTSFLATLAETATKQAWRVHAWAVMANHYHIALETPQPNLVEGMQWLQSTFALRFNRLRHENGHLFQGRYKSILIESGPALGALCHYIHLNPVRAGLCTVEQLAHWPWTSLTWLHDPSQRPVWYDPHTALRHSGEQPDSPAGRNRSIAYLSWLHETDTARKAAHFDRMSKGWVIGSAAFQATLAAERLEPSQRSAADARSLTIAHAEALIAQQLRELGRSSEDLLNDSKSAPWKIALAVSLKQQTLVTNRWLGERLHLGSLYQVSRKLGAWRTTLDKPDDETAKSKA